jgi:hypothetical protein
MNIKKALTTVAISFLFPPFLAAQWGVPLKVDGGDIGAEINAAFSACSSNCAVLIPPGTYFYSTTITMTKPSQSLIGAGSGQTVLNYQGSGDGIFWQMQPVTVTKGGTLKGFTINGTSRALNLIHSGSVQNSTWDDLVVSGATGPGANGILLENAVQHGFRCWTERTYMRNVQIGASGVGNSVGLHLLVNGGTKSFAYSDLEVQFNVMANQIGMLVDATAWVYHSIVNLKGNIDSAPASFLTVRGLMNQGYLTLLAEAQGIVPNAIHVSPTGNINASGNAAVLSTSYGATGGIVPPQIDTGGFYSVQPWLALDFPGANTATTQRPMIQTGSRTIKTDGTIVVAQSNNLQGRLILSWPDNGNRMALMILDVACTQFDSACSLDIPVNYSYRSEAVFTNPTIKLTGEAQRIPQLQVTIGNRNGIAQPVIASWYGSAGESPILFPGAALGGTAVALHGLASDGQGNLNFNGMTIIPSTVNGYHGGGVKLQLSDGTGSAGNQAVFASDGSVTNSAAGSAGHATCWKTIGQIGYCSTVVSSAGTCTCN